MESKLLKLLAPLDKDDQSLMKLDAIFAALNVEHEEDIYKLATYFTSESDTKQSPAVVVERTEEAAVKESEVSCASVRPARRSPGLVHGTAGCNSWYEKIHPSIGCQYACSL